MTKQLITDEIQKIYACLTEIQLQAPLNNDPENNPVLKQLLLIKDSLVKIKNQEPSDHRRTRYLFTKLPDDDKNKASDLILTFKRHLVKVESSDALCEYFGDKFKQIEKEIL